MPATSLDPLKPCRFSQTTANFLLEAAVERLHWKLDFADRDIGTSMPNAITLMRLLLTITGILLIRGENVVALGEVVSGDSYTLKCPARAKFP